MSHVVANQTGKSERVAAPVDLPPPDFCDPVIETYKKDVDRTLLRKTSN